MNIGKWALVNDKLIWFLVTILVLGGALSYHKMSKLEDPKIIVKQAVIVTTYPGASAYEVELQVSDPIEKSIRSMKNIDKIESRSSADLSMITVYIKTTVPDSELEQYWDIMRRKVAHVQSKLPQGASSSVVIDDYGDVFGMFYALKSDGFSNEELAKYGEKIKSEVQNIDGISNVTLFGVQTPTIEVAIHQDRMANLGVSPAEIITTIQGQNKSIYSGYYASGDKRIRVNVNDKYRDIEDIENLLIQGHEDDLMRLKDVATVTKSYYTPIRNAMFHDKMPSVGISISALDGTDITKLGREVESTLAELKETTLPIGIECEKVFYQPERVENAINTFAVNLIESIAIVILVLMFTMGFKSGVLLGVTLVVTVLGSIMMLNAFDGTIQRVSLASFILAMGMLVDNAIVIVDGILIDKKRGLLPSRSLTRIVGKTAMPLLGATLIAILAFFPIFLSPDTAGVYVRDMFIVLAVSLFLSWILSLTVVPLLAKKMLNPKKNGSDDQPYNTIFYKILRRTLTWSLNNRTLVVVLGFSMVVASIFIYKQLPQSFFPDMSYDQLYIEYKLGESSNSTEVENDLMEINDYLLSLDNVKHVTTSIGATPSRYNLVRSIATPSLSYGELIVDFVSDKELVASIPELQKYLNENYPQAYARVKRYNLMYSKYPIEAMFVGSDPDVLRSLTNEACKIMEQCDSLMLVTTDWDAKSPFIEVDYNQQVARRVGLSRSDVGMSILASTDGIPLNHIYDGNVSQTLIVKCVDNSGEQIESIENIPLFKMLPSLSSIDKDVLEGVMNGSVSKSEVMQLLLSTTPLSQTASDISVKWEDPLVLRYNGERAMRAQANNIPSVGAEAARQAIADKIEAIELPDGYSLSWQGEYSAKNQSMKYLFANLPLAIILMIVILIVLFKDYRKPAIILISVPLLIVGAILGVLTAGKSFGFVAICGVLGLIGMMIKSGIVLMDEIEMQIKDGKHPFNALLDSSASRFRPVMMASLTTILGMIPLLSDDMFGSLSATIMGGLLFGTVIIILYIPILYSIFFNVKQK